MLFPFTLALWSLSVVSALPALPEQKRDSDIDVTLSTKAFSVSSIEEVEILASVTNKGTNTVKLLKYGTILDGDLPTSSFTITKGGRPVPFIGVRLSVSLDDLDDSAFAIIKPGETLKVSHSVASLYDFASVGTGTFSFEPRADFIMANSADVAKTSFSDLTATTNSLTIEVTADVGSKVSVKVEKRARNVCTNSSRTSFINSGISEARTLASAATSYVNSRGTSDSLYTAYWGTNAASRVTSIFNAVSSENSNARTMDCTDPYGACSGGVIAYTVIATTNIYYCSIFFNEVPTTNLCGGTTVASRNVRGGTVLHELTHAVGNTDDVTYGCAADQRLSTAQKIRNADNFNCFSTQVYASTRC